MTTLKIGSKGNEVRQLQAKLSCAVDGIFGPLTEEAVKYFQTSKGLVPDGIVGPKTWAALGCVAAQTKRAIKELIVHCSATPECEDFTVEQIRQWHTLPKPQGNGWSDIGYHYVIYRDGSVHAGRSEAVSGAHCTGHNSISIGICYIGGCPPRSVNNWDHLSKDTRTPAQKQAIIKLLKELKQKYPGAKIYGHRDFANKPCPSFDAKTEYANL